VGARAEMYSLLLETYIKDSAEKHRLFHAVDTVPAVRRKAQWALKWIGRCAARPAHVRSSAASAPGRDVSVAARGRNPSSAKCRHYSAWQCRVLD